MLNYMHSQFIILCQSGNIHSVMLHYINNLRQYSYNIFCSSLDSSALEIGTSNDCLESFFDTDLSNLTQ